MCLGAFNYRQIISGKDTCGENIDLRASLISIKFIQGVYKHVPLLQDFVSIVI